MDLDHEHELDTIKEALKPDIYNTGLTLLFTLASSFPLFEYLLRGPTEFAGSGGAGFPYHYWATWEVADPSSTLQMTQIDPVFLLADLLILYLLFSLLIHLGKEGIDWL